MSELKEYTARRGQIKASLTRFSIFLNKVSDKTNVIEISKRLERIEASFSEFDRVQSALEIADDSQEQLDERDSFENDYYTLIANAIDLINGLSSKTHQDIDNKIHNTSSSFAESNVKLPLISLPEFCGNYEDWSNFHETFNVLIHNNASLANVQKFVYLKSVLKGQASDIIRSLPVTDSNYISAWNSLCERFSNPKLIIHSHIKSLFELPGSNKNCHKSLRKLTDEYLKHIRALQNLGEPTDTWSSLLIHLICTKLDSYSKNEWEQVSLMLKRQVMIQDFNDFLKDRCTLLETVNPILQFKATNNSGPKAWPHKKTDDRTYSHISTQNINCILCKENHYIYACHKFLKLNPKSRFDEIKKLKACINCLRLGHLSAECRSDWCKKCHKPHNTLLHFEVNANISNNTHDRSDDDNRIISTHCSRSIPECSILLSTANVVVFDSKHRPIKCRALLDSGSMSNFMTKQLCDRLGFKTEHINLPVIGINQGSICIHQRVVAKVKSTYNNYHKSLGFLILDKITEQIPFISFDRNIINIPNSITLADPEFNMAKDIDILLGAGIFYDLLCVGQIKVDNFSPIFQKTKLGWIISGPMTGKSCLDSSRISCNLSIDQNILNTLEKFWEVEHCNATRPKLSKTEIQCEDHFVSNFARTETGRFIVSLPLKDATDKLGNSRDTALKRFHALEQKFVHNQILKEKYSAFINEYEQLGHMTKIIDIGEVNKESDVFYLPHHGVLKEASSTTKLRVVFDASAKTSSGYSLNDLLLVGPSIQDELFEILLRFRTHKYVIIADAEKMYRQVLVENAHRDLQRIVWRENHEDELGHYQLNTITYGTAPASFLAIRVLFQLAKEYEGQFPSAAEIIRRDFYVDDLITGCDTIAGAIELARDITHILGKGCFNLRKWVANDQQILENISENSSNIPQYIITDNSNVKTLGLTWNAVEDVFKFTVPTGNLTGHITKRIILSTISKFFDPLGLAGPAIIKMKIMLQHLWRLGLQWDETVPLSLHTEYVRFMKQLPILLKIEVPRHILIHNAVSLELHGFCDASQTSYGCCLYLKSSDALGHRSIKLICAKSRVAPLKVVSLPKLELCGAHLLSELTRKALGSLNLSIGSIILWSDSTIVLAWLNTQPSLLKTFVANRVADIQQLTSATSCFRYWKHVRSQDNPADVISRGIEPEKLLNCNIWWSGPSWLIDDQSNWPSGQVVAFDEIPELKRAPILSHHSSSDIFDIFFKFSSYVKLRNVTAYCLRFAKNCKITKDSRINGPLAVSEINDSLNVLVRLVQKHTFAPDFERLKNKKQLSSKSNILSLNPFIDSNSLIRVGGRLSKSSLPQDHKFPLVLPNKHPFTTLLISYYHTKNFHSGPQATLAAIRQQFWPLHGKSAVRKVTRACVVCFRAKPLTSQALMGDLPTNRITPARPFANVGIDFAGPLLVKDGTLRNRKLVKCYLCVFVCLLTKAVHFELVGDLTTDSFLNALKRFVSRRGICSSILSDNGTNFVGANNELKQLYSHAIKLIKHDEVVQYSNQNSIEWRFSPPRSPHFGGLWEAAVKSAKYHIARIIGNSHLHYEGLYTVLTQIEAIMNSRPLTPLSDDPSDLDPLTPGHFLIGDALTSVPEKNLDGIPANKLTHYLRLQQLLQHFWKRWSQEYLASLQQRTKWEQKRPSQLKEGILVVLKSENTAPLNWPMGRILELHPGQDGIVRVVTVRTISGRFKRAVNRICVLPINN